MSVCPLVLIPGLMCDHRVWSPVLPVLGSERETLIADHGNCDSLISMAQLVLDTAPPRFDMAGHSMGGRVALEVYRLAPERVRRIALMNTGYLPLAPGATGETERAGRMQLLALAQTEGVRAMAAQWVRNMVAPERLADVALIQQILDMFESKTAAVFERQIHALLTRPHASDVLSDLQVPCLIMTGEHDGWANVAQHRAMAALMPTPAPVSVIAQAGHMLTMEQPESVAQVMLKWLG
jgi:pimeloyl-ACP methyl ester carboxylesterase